MAISKPKKPNLLDDLVLNFDPFVENGLQELNSSLTVQGEPAVQEPGGDQTPAPEVTGTAGPALGDAGTDDAPTVTLFRVELSATANAESDGPPTVAGTPAPAPEIPGPQGPPPPVADPDFDDVAPEEPDNGPPPTVQEGAGNSSGAEVPDSALGTPGGSGIAGASLTDWWLA